MPEFQIKNHTISAPDLEPGLYITATPIGNLGDITIRALEVMAGSDLIACEDTRVTRKLLDRYNIKTRTVSYHEHNAQEAGQRLLNELREGKSIVLVSDAGTPIVSDPGFRLVDMAREAGIPVHPVPGATAPVAALVASGLEAGAFTFAGFLPTKQGARQKELERFSGTPSTLIFFESPNRISKSLKDMAHILGGNRRAAVARELTKLHEEIATGTLDELTEQFESRTVKGEIVVLIEAATEETEVDVDATLLELLNHMSVSKAAAEAVTLTGLSKRDLYQRALALKAGE